MAKSPKNITIPSDIGIIAGIALISYGKDQEEKGHRYTAASVYRDAATVFRKLNRADIAVGWEGVADRVLAAARADDRAESERNPDVLSLPL
jgi:hypothetical protein